MMNNYKLFSSDLISLSLLFNSPNNSLPCRFKGRPIIADLIP